MNFHPEALKVYLHNTLINTWQQETRSNYETNLVICISMKTMMKSRRAGMLAPKMAQIGSLSFIPSGWITQPRFSDAVGLRPFGTSSFCADHTRCN